VALCAHNVAQSMRLAKIADRIIRFPVAVHLRGITENYRQEGICLADLFIQFRSSSLR